jgi:hypothetical protein
MKRLSINLLVLFVLFFIGCSSAAFQSATPEDCARYQKVFDMKIKDGALFDQAAKNANLILNVKYSDKATKTISGDGIVNIFGGVRYDAEIMVKENRMRIVFSNMKTRMGGFVYQNQVNGFREEADGLMSGLVNRINSSNDDF